MRRDKTGAPYFYTNLTSGPFCARSARRRYAVAIGAFAISANFACCSPPESARTCRTWGGLTPAIRQRIVTGAGNCCRSARHPLTQSTFEVLTMPEADLTGELRFAIDIAALAVRS